MILWPGSNNPWEASICSLKCRCFESDSIFLQSKHLKTRTHFIQFWSRFKQQDLFTKHLNPILILPTIFINHSLVTPLISIHCVCVLHVKAVFERSRAETQNIGKSLFPLSFLRRSPSNLGKSWRYQSYNNCKFRMKKYLFFHKVFF